VIDHPDKRLIKKLQRYSTYSTKQIMLISRVFHPTTWQYTFFHTDLGFFSKIDQILGNKAIHNKLKKTEITLYILSDHNRINLDLNNKRNHRKYSNTWSLNNTLLKNQCVTEVIRKEIEKFLEYNGNENTTYQNLWDTAKSML
jgi:hypothetical protein